MLNTFVKSASRPARRAVMRLAATSAVALAVVSLSACGLFDLARDGPNEFDVVTYAPLTLPPDFGLRPPDSESDSRPQNDPRNQARQILTTGSTDSSSAPDADQPVSEGEQALLEKAGALSPEPGIRSIIDHESSRVEEKRLLIDRLISPFSGGSDTKETKKVTGRPIDAVIDPDKETQRLQEEGKRR